MSGATPPVIEVPTEERKAREAQLQDELAALEEELANFEAELNRAQPAWEESRRKSVTESPWRPLTVNSAKAEKQQLTVLDDGSGEDTSERAVRKDLWLL